MTPEVEVKHCRRLGRHTPHIWNGYGLWPRVRKDFRCIGHIRIEGGYR